MNHRSLPRSAALALALGALGAASVLAPPAARAAAPDGRFSLSGARVHVYNLAGTVEVVPGSGRAVTVESTTGGKDGGRIDVRTMPGNEPALIFAYPASERRIVYRRNGAGRSSSFRVNMDVGADGRFGDGWGKNGLGLGRRKVEIRSDGTGFEAWADLRIGIPEGQRADLHLGVGAVRVTNVNGELRVDCAAAGVEASGTRGALHVDTGSGAVSVRDAADVVSVDTGSGAVSLIDFSGTLVSVDTGSGSVKLAAVTATRQVDVDTGSGSVEVVDVRSPRVGVDTGSGRVYLRLAADVDQLDVDTGSGSVTVEAPSTLDATVRMETGSGGLDVDFPMRLLHREDDSLEGTIGRGRGRITLETGSGKIRLVKV
jgi:lia operon protein LiaG